LINIEYEVMILWDEKVLNTEKYCTVQLTDADTMLTGNAAEVIEVVSRIRITSEIQISDSGGNLNEN
jgi:hypothetical protein